MPMSNNIITRGKTPPLPDKVQWIPFPDVFSNQILPQKDQGHQERVFHSFYFQSPKEPFICIPFEIGVIATVIVAEAPLQSRRSRKEREN